MDIIELFREAGGYLTGHFLLTSGRHSEGFLRAAALTQQPELMARACGAMAALFDDDKIDVVVGPASGGIVVAHEVAKSLGARMAFSERDNDRMVVLRGFRLGSGDRAIVVDDVMTTGGSIRKTIEHLAERGVEVVGVGVFVDRSGGRVSFDVPVRSLGTIEIDTFESGECPLCKDNVPVTDPDGTTV